MKRILQPKIPNIIMYIYNLLQSNKGFATHIKTIKVNKSFLPLYFIVISLFTLFFKFVFAQESLIEIRIGSENTYKPFAYIDSKGKATGFDNDIANAVAEYMPCCKISIISVPWNTIFSGLDSQKFDVVANQITKTLEREKKYIFSTQPYFYGISGLIVGENSTIKDLNDFHNGDKIGVTVGSNHALNLEKYLKEHPNARFTIHYYKTSPTLIAELANGRIKGMINDPISAIDYAKAQRIKIQVTNFYLDKTPIYFIFRKDSQELARTFDEAYIKASKAGKIEAIIKQYFGEEYVKLLKEIQ
ncbi:hypothetical protein CQA53_06185 [Helicobacter didelphidarum]|uniref:Solute-binding protein family 3/N-terminal domain-containing protein n=1 Tax=Helicobacter didelphidarum TaxID=2040648 RepID=A0A3D8IJG8_9HELI|nr:transporter substrate-binding domain-containing protein [Helicobacter didelphidarum]RDU65359.1 hypothetical protein CQA53_06185 [Helicobacter didelphidarum]